MDSLGALVPRMVIEGKFSTDNTVKNLVHSHMRSLMRQLIRLSTRPGPHRMKGLKMHILSKLMAVCDEFHSASPKHQEGFIA